MDISLAELAGFADDDPEVGAARTGVTAYANLIEGLVELRHRRRMTQADVAEVMGTTQSVVSHFERPGGDAASRPFSATRERSAQSCMAYQHRRWNGYVDRFAPAPTAALTRPTARLQLSDHHDTPAGGARHLLNCDMHPCRGG